MTSTRLALFLTPAALVVGVLRPPALLALVALTVFATAVSRVTLWLLGDGRPGRADAQAVRVGAGVFSGAVAVAALLLALGPASVPVLAVLALAGTACAALRFRPGRAAH